MPTTDQLRKRLVNKLKELFQLDQPDLDFGFYRIMHAKSAQITEFLEKDLLKVIEDSFGKQSGEKAVSARDKAHADLEAALGAGALDENGKLKDAFAETPAGKAYVAAISAADATKEAVSAEGEIYDHLYRFFERYYEDGDFISRRYLNRETDGRAAPFAIPYNGEEVKLHWANADQYYIKTGEYFSNFTVDLAKTPEVAGKEDELGLKSSDGPLPVHFRLVDAAEGEHGNVKATDATKRFFILHAEDPIGFDEAGELELRFEYRPDPDKSGQDAKWQQTRRDEACSTLLEKLAAIPEAKSYLRLLAAKMPTDKNKDRTLLEKYLHQYTARNTADYFIHKDLGSFLRRELDFYIKNEVMRLDDIEHEDAPRVESYLAKLKVLRTIARQLIDFLAQLENFQKKLWLKKKFVTETNYCITLDRIREDLYPEITANDAQREEWVKLYAIDEIEDKNSDDLLKDNQTGYSSPLKIEFLKSQPHLVLDTRHFDQEFKVNLIDSIDNLEDACDGLLVHSENFQGLSLLAQRTLQQVGVVYTDPPYNTGNDGFSYRDGYQRSSWSTMISQTFSRLRASMRQAASAWVSIDDNEVERLKLVLAQSLSPIDFFAHVLWQKRYAPDIRTAISDAHEHILVFGPSYDAFKEQRAKLPLTSKQTDQFSNPDEDENGPWKSDNLTAQGYRPNQMYEIELPSGRKVTPPAGRCWATTEDKFLKMKAAGRIYFPKGGEGRPGLKRYLKEMDGMVPWTWWDHREVGHSQKGLKTTMELFGRDGTFLTAKPPSLIERCLRIGNTGESQILDFFAGSGTTGHAVINLNREDNGKRKYILIEMGSHFDTVLKPRIAKVVYSPDWKDGMPTGRNKGVSHCFKYIRLESYEDTLNNLRFAEDKERKKALEGSDALRRDYTLNYMLDVETRGSASLLNIEAFTDPTAYKLKVKKHGATESIEQPVDLIETFNFLIGLRVENLAAPQTFSAKFQRVPDADLPEGTDTRLQLDGKLKQEEKGAWWFRKVEGWVPKDRENPNNGQREKVLIVWRKLTGNAEEDNLMLDEWFQKNRLSTRDFEFDTIYVNGSNNLPNLKLDGDTWKVRLLEEEFHKAMWDVQDV